MYINEDYDMKIILIIIIIQAVCGLIAHGLHFADFIASVPSVVVDYEKDRRFYFVMAMIGGLFSIIVVTLHLFAENGIHPFKHGIKLW